MKKKYNKGIIIFLCISIVALIKIRVVGKSNIYYVAKIYHNELVGIDEEIEYAYYIYPNKNNTYTYIKSKCFITSTGASKEKYIKKGKLKDKSDFEKIRKSINMDKCKTLKQDIGYIYIQNGERKIGTSIEELSDKLF